MIIEIRMNIVHTQGTCGDLDQHEPSLATLLVDALEELREERYDDCIATCDALSSNSWGLRNLDVDSRYGGGGSQWPHVSVREAYVFSLLLLGCASASAASPDYNRGVTWTRVSGSLLVMAWFVCLANQKDPVAYSFPALEALDTSVILSGMLPPTRSMLQYCEPLAKKCSTGDRQALAGNIYWAIPTEPPKDAPAIQHPIIVLDFPEQSTFAEFVNRNEALKMTGTRHCRC